MCTVLISGDGVTLQPIEPAPAVPNVRGLYPKYSKINTVSLCSPTCKCIDKYSNNSRYCDQTCAHYLKQIAYKIRLHQLHVFVGLQIKHQYVPIHVTGMSSFMLSTVFKM